MTDWCDTDEGGEDVFTPMPTHCQRFECNVRFDYRAGRRTTDLPPAPLVRNDEGFMECPRCHSKTLAHQRCGRYTGGRWKRDGHSGARPRQRLKAIS